MSDTKRLLVWLFMVIWCVLSLAFDVRAQGTIDLAANTIIIKKKAVASAAAGGGAGYVGSEVTTGTANACPPGYAFAMRIQATATGSLTTAHWYRLAGADATTGKVIVYGPSSQANPNDESTLARIGASAEISSLAAGGWFTAAITGSVTSGQYYWIIITTNISGGNWDLNLGSTSATYYIDDWSANYASPPATIGSGWSALGTYSPMAAYAN